MCNVYLLLSLIIVCSCLLSYSKLYSYKISMGLFHIDQNLFYIKENDISINKYGLVWFGLNGLIDRIK